MHPDDRKSTPVRRVPESSSKASGSSEKRVSAAMSEKRKAETTSAQPASGTERKAAYGKRNISPELEKCHGPVILVCVVMVLFIIAQVLLQTEAFTKQNPYIALVVVQFFVFILPCAFMSAFGNHKMNGGLAQYNLRMLSPRMFGFVFSSLAVLLFGNMVIKYLGYMLFGSVSSTTVVYENDNMFALIAATVLVPAVTEEILLRGVVFTEYEKRGVGPLGAIIGSAVLFAFIHFDVKDFVSYLFAGIILAVTVHVTRSLLAPVIVHLLNNTICLFTDTFLKRVSKESISSFFVFFLLTVLFLLSLFAFFESLEWICNSRADKKAANDGASDEDANVRLLPKNMRISSILSSVFLTPAFIIVLVLYIFEMIAFK